MPRDLPAWRDEFARRTPRLDPALAHVLAGLLANEVSPIDLLFNVHDWLKDAETQFTESGRDAGDLYVARTIISREAALRQARAR